MARTLPPPEEPEKRKKVVPRPRKSVKTSAAMKYLRDSRIVHDWLSGLSYERIGEKHGVQPDTARKICADWKRYVFIATDEDPLDYLNRRLAQYEVKYGQLAEILDGEGTDEAKVSAIRAQLVTMKDATTMRQQHGVLPKDLGRITVAVNFKLIGATIARILDEEEVPVPVLERIEGALRSAATSAGVNGHEE